MAGRKPEQFFGGVPTRAFADDRLGFLHWRVLAVVAAHDRMSRGRGGRGCTAGNERLVKMVRCNPTNLSTAINELTRWGYIDSDRHPDDRRWRVLRVIYTDEDKAVMKGDSLPTGQSNSRGDSLPTGQPFSRDSLPTGGKLVCPDSEKTSLSQRDKDRKRAGRDSAEAASLTGRGKNSVETAPPDGVALSMKNEDDSTAQDQHGNLAPAESKAAMKKGDESNPEDNAGQTLAQLDRWLKGIKGKTLTPADRTRLVAAEALAQNVENDHEVTTTLGGWARRVREDVGMLMDEIGDDGEAEDSR